VLSASLLKSVFLRVFDQEFIATPCLPDCEWGKKMCDLGEEQLLLCYSEFRSFESIACKGTIFGSGTRHRMCIWTWNAFFAKSESNHMDGFGVNQALESVGVLNECSQG
jgi:hypothetical protein